MVEEKTNIPVNIEDDIQKEEVLDLDKLSNDELMEFYRTIDEHLKYLNNNILSLEED